MKKTKLTAVMLSAVMLIGATAMPSFAVTKEVKVKVNGSNVSFDQKPYIDENSRTQVPIAFIAQKLGAKVSWDEKAWKVTIEKETDTIVLTINSNKVSVNGESQTIDTKATITGGRTYVPLAFISQCLGADVKWDASTWTVIVTTDGDIVEIPSEEKYDVDFSDYYKTAPLDITGYPLTERMEKFTFIETTLDKFPYKVTEIVPMANMGNIPNYNVDMGIIVRTEVNVPITFGVIDKEGRYFDLSKTANLQYSNEFFISTEVTHVVQYVTTNNHQTKTAYIAPVTVYTGFSGEAKNHTKYLHGWEDIKGKLGL